MLIRHRTAEGEERKGGREGGGGNVFGSSFYDHVERLWWCCATQPKLRRTLMVHYPFSAMISSFRKFEVAQNHQYRSCSSEAKSRKTRLRRGAPLAGSLTSRGGEGGSLLSLIYGTNIVISTAPISDIRTYLSRLMLSIHSPTFYA